MVEVADIGRQTVLTLPYPMDDAIGTSIFRLKGREIRPNLEISPYHLLSAVRSMAEVG